MATALGTLYKTLLNYLQYQGNWDSRVYLHQATAGATRPYVVFFMVGGGELNAVRKQDAEFLLTVKVVADTYGAADTGASELSSLLNDRGRQDVTSAPVSAIAGSGWEILTITQERAIDILETFENAAPIYHVGNQYRFLLEHE